MRLTIFFLLTLLVFSASASASSTNDTSVANNTTSVNSTVAQACSDCWIAQRNQNQACQNIPSEQVANFATLTDDALVQNSTQYSALITCLCTLSKQVETLVAACPPCSGLADGLNTEGSLVSKNVCGLSATVTDNNSNNNKNSNQAGDSTTDSNSATQTTDGSSSDATVNADANNAVSIAPWSKSIFSLTVALVAAWLCAF